MHIYILTIGLAGVIIIGLLIKVKNDLLIQQSKKNSYTAYNNAATKSSANELIKTWQENPAYFKAVKEIILIDYIWMLFFGGTILYALGIGFYYKAGYFKYLCAAAMVLLVVAIAIDALQDYEIYRHLNRQSFLDVRLLTKPKFALLLIAVVIALAAIIKNWDTVIHQAFWKFS